MSVESDQFLLFLTAVLKAADDYADLLRISVASPGNDHRLGANEAPPAVVSMFLGDELCAVLDAIEHDDTYSSRDLEMMKIGVHVLPKFPKDSTDRNRTSPFAFTGNKFEFRMLGSSNSIADANTTLNTAVARVLADFADTLEGAEDFQTVLHNLIRDTVRAHKRILFNGNGYGEEWYKEAERRGLPNYKTTPDALPHLLDEKNIKLFTEMRIFTETELRARYEILEENYAKVVAIEALTMIEMTERDILPAASLYATSLAESIAIQKASIGASPEYEVDSLSRIAELKNATFTSLRDLKAAYANTAALADFTKKSESLRDTVLPIMKNLRASVDELETLVARDYWPYPSYGEILLGSF